MSDVVNDQELKALLNFLVVLGGQVEKVVAKGSLSLLDLPGFFSAFQAASPALSGIKDLPAEISSLSDASLSDLRAYLQSNLQSVVPNPVIDGLINDGLALAQQLFDFIESLKNAKSSAPVSPPPAAPAA